MVSSTFCCLLGFSNMYICPCDSLSWKSISYFPVLIEENLSLNGAFTPSVLISLLSQFHLLFAPFTLTLKALQFSKWVFPGPRNWFSERNQQLLTGMFVSQTAFSKVNTKINSPLKSLLYHLHEIYTWSLDIDKMFCAPQLSTNVYFSKSRYTSHSTSGDDSFYRSNPFLPLPPLAPVAWLSSYFPDLWLGFPWT